MLLTLSDSALKDFYYLGNAGNPLAVTSNTSDGLKCYTYQKDVQGSTRAVTDSNGQCVKWYEYTDFGETTVHEEQASFDNELCYTGGVYDENTGLYYLNARYYNPETGRFISRDTYEGTSEEPSSLHLYLYCANDPVNYVDPSGHKKIATIYYKGKKKGFTEQAHYNLYYHPKNSNVKYYGVLSGEDFFKTWKKVSDTKASDLYLFMHGKKGTLTFYNNEQISAAKLKKKLKINRKLKNIYLISCEGAAGGKYSSVAGALWERTARKAKIYASYQKVSFTVVNDGIYSYYTTRYSNRYRFAHPWLFWRDPIKLLNY